MKKLVLFFLENREHFDNKTHLKISGYDMNRNLVSFDLAEDKVVATKKVVKLLRVRSVDSKSVFQAIREAYDECKHRFPPANLNV